MARNSEYYRLNDLVADNNSQPFSGEHEDSCARRFDSRKQGWRLFRERCVQLIITIVLVGLVCAVLLIFHSAGNSSHIQKNGFNVLITVLTLALGLNFFEAFKDMAKVARWRVLASSRYSIYEVDLIMGGESLMKLSKLMRESRKRPWIVLACGVWILLNLLAQGLIAMISLTFTFDKASDSSGIITTPGPVVIPKLDCYYNSNGTCPDVDPLTPETAQTVAHTYGEDIRSQTRCTFSTTADLLANSTQNCYYFSNLNDPSFAYQYRQFNPQDQSKSYPFLAPRLITTSSDQCTQFFVNEPASGWVSGTDGPQSIWEVHYYNETYNGTLRVPRELSAFDSTTYVWDDDLTPQNSSKQACGPRCVWLYAVREHRPGQARPVVVFQCAITISKVFSEGSSPEMALPDPLARLAAASIALSGRYANTPPPGPGTTWRQAQYFSHGSYWETDSLTAELVGSRMAEFAIGSLARMARLNPTTIVVDTQPVLGYSLTVEWHYTLPLLVAIVVVHVLVLAATLWSAHGIVIGDDSFLVLARLMAESVFDESHRSNVEAPDENGLRKRGYLLNGRELASVIKSKGRGAGISYWSERNKEGRYELRLSAKASDKSIARARNRRRSDIFPCGIYS